MELFYILLAFGLVLAFFIFVIRLPIIIAKKRGVTDDELTTIAILSWISILVGITWIVALVLSLVYKPKKWIDKDDSSDNLSQLETLYTLKQKGIISEEEFEQKKKQIMKGF